MRVMNSHSNIFNFLRWFDPRNRQFGTWGFIINRITALGLTLYLVMHLFMLFKLSQGAASYDQFIALAKTPVVKLGEMLVIAGGILHGTNGIRIALNSFGVGVRQQRGILITLFTISIIIILYFFYRMFFFD
jgi:succinate dehydrogenase / fumarate reductase, cytochrome b subunit